MAENIYFYDFQQHDEPEINWLNKTNFIIGIFTWKLHFCILLVFGYTIKGCNFRAREMSSG